MTPDLKLGQEVRDTISGFTGIATCISERLNGCKRITISPRVRLHDGKPIPDQTFDVEQIAIVSFETPITPAPTGGPSIAPQRPADPSR